ncbi:hypothetical protein IGS67_00700 [Flavimobilis sp. GY10621]|uniref:WD40-like Beta Propeller Repeat n=1 Tax=Flavimobilis rhizosphaerae TaxID=2775421 RepID=A0ABR9DLP5_9MICO|nr:hypothetical protein [Flavimobilis rhizosphaerae]
MTLPLLAAVTLTAACTPEAPRPPAAATPSATGTATPSGPTQLPTPSKNVEEPRALLDPDGRVLDVRWVPVASQVEARQGETYTVLDTIRSERGCVERIGARAVLGGGATVVGIGPKETCTWDGGPRLPANDRIGVRDADGTLRRFVTTEGLVPEDDPRQITAVAASATHVVWAETASTDLFHDDWRIFAARLDDGVPHLVAKAEDFTGGKEPLTFFEVQLAVGADRVWWSTAPADGEGPPVVVSRRLDGTGPIDVVAKASDSPVVTSDGLVVRTLTEVSTMSQDDQGEPAAEIMWRGTGLALVADNEATPLLSIDTTETLGTEEELGALSSDGVRVAFAVGDAVYALDLSREAIVGVHGGGVKPTTDISDEFREATTIASTALDEGRLVWSFGGGAGATTSPVYVLELASDALQRIVVEDNAGEVVAAAGNIAWSGFVDDRRTTTVVDWRD